MNLTKLTVICDASIALCGLPLRSAAEESKPPAQPTAGSLRDAPKILTATELSAAQETLKNVDRDKEPRRWLDAAVTVARTLHGTGRHSELGSLATDLSSNAEKVYGAQTLETARVMELVAEINSATGSAASAEHHYMKAMGIREAVQGREHPDLSPLFSRLSAVVQNRAGTAGAAAVEPLLRRALAIDEAAFGREHRHVAIRLSDLAAALGRTGRNDEAEKLYRRAVAIHQAASPPNDGALAVCYTNFGGLLQQMKKPAEAEDCYRKALAIDEAAGIKDDPRVARELANLGVFLDEQKRYAESEPVLRRSMEILARASVTARQAHPHLKLARETYLVHLVDSGLTAAQADAKVSEILRPILQK